MLVYLDSAHFDYLERASAPEVDQFHSSWARAGCELALSLHHLQEIAQLADEVSIARRLATIERFPTVRCLPATSDLVLRLEAQVQIIKALGYEVDLARSAVATLFPPTSFADIAHAVESHGAVLRSMREPLTVAADASNLTKGQKRPSLRRQIPPDERTRLDARTLALEALKGQPSEVSEMVLDLSNRLEIEVARVGNLRAALEAMYRIDTVDARSSILDPDLAGVAVFFQTARNEAREVAEKLSLRPDDALEAVEKLNPYACPGLALQLAARRGRESHPKPDEPGDEIDLAHLSFAPYVTVLLADKRTHAFIHQEAKRSHGRLRPAFASNIIRAGSLLQLEKQIGLRAVSM